jgi:hypothetical protein
MPISRLLRAQYRRTDPAQLFENRVVRQDRVVRVDSREDVLAFKYSKGFQARDRVAELFFSAGVGGS